MKSRICIVFSNSEIRNGATRSMLDLIEFWVKYYHDIDFVCLVREKGELDTYLKELGLKTIVCKYNGVRYYPTINKNKSIFINLFKCFRMFFEKLVEVGIVAHKLKYENINAIYSNTGAIYFGIWLSLKLNLPHIWHIREMGEEDQNAKMYIGKKYFKYLLNKSEKIVTISRVVYNKYLKYMKNKSKICMFYNDLSKKNICFINHRLNKNVFKILIVGSIIEGKGHEHLIYSISMLKKMNIPVELYIAGREGGEFYNKIKQIINNENIVPNVHFLGQVTQMNELRRCMDVQVVASKCEAFGRITIEAMLAGLPVIGANCGGTKELIENNKTGVLYEFNNVEDLTNKLYSCYVNYNKNLEYAYNAYNIAVNFTKGNTAKNIYDLLLSFNEQG